MSYLLFPQGFLKPFRVPLVAVAILSAAACSAQWTSVNHRTPPHSQELYDVWWNGNGMIPEQLFWQYAPQKADPADQLAARNHSEDERINNGRHCTIMLMMWGSAYYNSKPGADRTYSDKDGFTQYWNWMNDREHYFARKPNGDIWSKSYEGDGSPKDAWITPSRTLDPADQSSAIKTFGDWYANRIVSFAAVTDFSGITLADYADELPASTINNHDFSQDIVEDFESLSGINVSGNSSSEWADDILNNHRSDWIDYYCDTYAAFWMKMVNGMEDAHGFDSIVTLQKQCTAHVVRERAADARFMRKHARRSDQIVYQSQYWMTPRSYGMGNGELSSHCLGNASHFCREPDMGRIVMLPCSDTDYYTGESAGKMDLWHVIHDADNEYNYNLSNSEKKEWGDKSMLGTWTVCTWAHIANRNGDLERVVNSVHRQNNWSYYPDVIWNNVLKQRYPKRPYGPAFYYSVNIEKSLENENQRWQPEDKIAQYSRGNFFPGYYVSDAALNNLKSANYPSCWITDEYSRLTQDEKNELAAIAPVYDISELSQAVNDGNVPINFNGDCSGFAFVDQNDEVIIVVTRDAWDNTNTITAEIEVRGVADGNYTATGLYSSETISFTVTGGIGTFSTPLERWQTKAFSTNLPLNVITVGNGIPIGSTIALKAQANGNYVCADRDLHNTQPPLVAVDTGIKTQNMFDVIDAGSGMIALRAAVNNRFVVTEKPLPDAPLEADRTFVGDWEKFTWINNTDGKISLKAKANSKYVCADKNLTNVPLVANRTSIGAWEKFTWEYVGPVRLDCGGDGIPGWNADSAGSISSTPEEIDTSTANSAPEAIYQSRRTGEFTCIFPNLTPGSACIVRLHFAELYWQEAKQREINVSINGTQVLNDFDIFVAASNQRYKAVAEDIPAVADAAGKIAVSFTNAVGTAECSGIEIIPASLTTQPM